MGERELVHVGWSGKAFLKRHFRDLKQPRDIYLQILRKRVLKAKGAWRANAPGSNTGKQDWLGGGERRRFGSGKHLM